MKKKNKYNPEKHNRHSIRLKGYDYSSPGYYFVTVCTFRHRCILGDVVKENMILSKYGHDVEYTWYDLPKHNFHIALDQFIVMPNHIHGIIIIKDLSVGAGSEPAPTKKQHGLPEIIRQLQTFSARRINQKRNTIGRPVWQRNYYDHIIRNEGSLHRIREYIIYNPLKWESDKENPINWKKKP